MIVSKINTGDFIYYDLHSEEVITSNFIEDVNLGIYCDRLQSITMDRISADITNKGTEGETKIAFDFTRIVAVQTNINGYFTTLKNIGYSIVFMNITKEIIGQLGYDSIANSDNKDSTIIFFDKTTLNLIKKEGYSRFYFFENKNDFFPNNFKIEPVFKEYFKNKLKLYCENHDKQHTSSYVYLTSYINIKKFISHEKQLCLFSIIKLAIKALKEWRQSAPIPPYFPDIKNEIKAPILVCQSLNSSYFVSVLSNLLKLDVLILDKIGPINRIYNSMNKSIIQDRNYIVVSDLVCLGTEVKIVKNIIEFLGGRYLGNIALIKTETLKKKDIKKKDATVAIFSLDRTNNKELKYFITTDLEENNE
jgi:hypothetical protein